MKHSGRKHILKRTEMKTMTDELTLQWKNSTFAKHNTRIVYMPCNAWCTEDSRSENISWHWFSNQTLPSPGFQSCRWLGNLNSNNCHITITFEQNTWPQLNWEKVNTLREVNKPRRMTTHPHCKMFLPTGGTFIITSAHEPLKLLVPATI